MEKSVGLIANNNKQQNKNLKKTKTQDLRDKKNEVKFLRKTFLIRKRKS